MGKESKEAFTRRNKIQGGINMPDYIKVFLSGFLMLYACIYVPSVAYAEETLSLGVFPRRNAEDTIRMYTPLAEYLTEKIGIKVNINTARDFETFWEHISKKRFHIVHYNPHDYIKSAKEYGYRVIVKNEENGSDTLAGAIFVNKSSGISDIQGLKGKRIVFGGGPSAMFSYLLPSYLLQKGGLNEGDYIKEYAISPPNAVFAAYYGHADAAGAGESILGFDVLKKKIDTTKVKAIAVSQKLTHLPWAVREDVDTKLSKKIQKLLSELSQTEKGKKILKSAALTGLNISSDAEYDEHRKIIWHVRGDNYCVRDCGYIGKSQVSAGNKQELVMGIFPRRSRELTISLFQPMANYLSAQLGRSVRLDIRNDFKEFWGGVTKQQYDIVHYNQYQYVKSHKLYNYDIVLKNEEQGLTTLTPSIWVRKDSGINSPADLRGKKIMFGGGKTAMLTYIGPTYLLRQAGVKKGEYEELFANNPVNGCRAMFFKQADACGSGTIMMSLPVVKKTINTDKVKLVSTGEPISHLSWAVKRSMSKDLRQNIQNTLSSLNKTESGRKILKKARLTGLHIAKDKDYDVHRKIIGHVLSEKY